MRNQSSHQTHNNNNRLKSLTLSLEFHNTESLHTPKLLFSQHTQGHKLSDKSHLLSNKNTHHSTSPSPPFV
ncbi:hypothetical protein HanRHA438_Chr04g0182341 [Helianthus annuus]|uniref:Uncharacterized protein n=1 Tax=Helianthus annuus TaxID=4232 RepID=A0A251V1N2_HELAN|nr:hypothetical protein HanXRQr2_Chr04g0172671 [Helianthus annuus]KAJ0581481.1 hypothetical protein HanHA300_Chr04g0141551 [Helianthus annuus]KAJ0589436.1 hypothetical protein HanIR_Chr04g0186251 [Helianthus annuus]KAJ0597431.1 hypothetical protein HanHA89_Chr04g0154551 [Helianthus annuus]KAJ0761755.1 hypothetical protein HanOQP8_Chr04g0153621 [Helianthus annuus]